VAAVIERASSGRAKCRGCGERIARDALRLGERMPNPFGEGEMTLWFHPACAAYKRPEPFLEAARTAGEALADLPALEAAARRGLAHRRLPRIDGVRRAPSGRARCRCCREPIAQQAWRIPLVYYEEGRFEPSGYVHLRCAPAYFETAELFDRLAHFSPELAGSDLDAVRAELEGR
jgi:hypothetical protein